MAPPKVAVAMEATRRLINLDEPHRAEVLPIKCPVFTEPLRRLESWLVLQELLLLFLRVLFWWLLKKDNRHFGGTRSIFSTKRIADEHRIWRFLSIQRPERGSKLVDNLFISTSLPPIHVEPAEGSWIIFLLKGPFGRFHVNWWEGAFFQQSWTWTRGFPESVGLPTADRKLPRGGYGT